MYDNKVAFDRVVLPHQNLLTEVYSLEYKIIRIINAEGTFSICGKKETASNRSVVFFPMGKSIHIDIRSVSNKPIELEVVTITEAFFNSTISMFSSDPNFKQKEVVSECEADVRDKIGHYLDAYVTLENIDVHCAATLHCSLAYSILRELVVCGVIDPFYELMAKKKTSKRVTEVILSDLTNKWKLSDVACCLNMSNSTLQRKLKGESLEFSVLLSTVRLEVARKTLTCSDTCISKVALDCGFESLAYFSYVFKKRYGMTPTQCKKTLIKPS
ncbi:helix-turn-helix domain-containing protein [Vibrio mediterranei]|uniref:HTH araC/xylS-type domain-containing protein n=1 Tax=Vibrio mediterranei TaxID=689 RepID=A0AAN1KQM7_9VIBR|nr:AraC family transcriptional regulator [Vibrio mediterranei]ASI92712.1 hypothetical protein BSZ05_23375 [Vibrio mediterranei]